MQASIVFHPCVSQGCNHYAQAAVVKTCRDTAEGLEGWRLWSCSLQGSGSWSVFKVLIFVTGFRRVSVLRVFGFLGASRLDFGVLWLGSGCWSVVSFLFCACRV